MFQSSRLLKISYAVVLACAAGLSDPAIAQQNTSKSSGQQSGGIPPNYTANALNELNSALSAMTDDINKAKQALDDGKTFVVTETRKNAQAGKAPAGPPRPGQMLNREARQRVKWLEATRDQLKERVARAKRAKNPAEAYVYAKDALLKADLGRNLSESILGSSSSAKSKGGQRAAASGKQSGSSSSGPKRPTSGGITFRSSTFDQLKTVTEPTSKAAARAKSLVDAKSLARDAFEADGAGGRAGAGGVALYKAASVLPALDPAKLASAQTEISVVRVPYHELYQARLNEIAAKLGHAIGDDEARALGLDRQIFRQMMWGSPQEGAASPPADLEKARLVMTYDGRRFSFPPLDPQYLAIAIRSVYGGEGLMHGTLHAIEKTAVVLRTGKEQYGEVVWKREFLPDFPRNAKIGEETALEFGPGVGVLSLPEPSIDRTTYYGPVKGNLLGKVLQEADKVFSMFWNGVDWKTGKPLDPNALPGYDNRIEIDLRRPVEPKKEQSSSAKKPQPKQKAKNWWDDTYWYVWVPGEMSLRVAEDTGRIDFTKATMKCHTWNARGRESEHMIKEGVYLTEHYDDLSRAFPVLAQLKEAAKTVAIVRWLKKNRVPVDLEWAKSYGLAKVETPERISRFTVVVYRDKNGKPQVEEPPAKDAGNGAKDSR